VKRVLLASLLSSSCFTLNKLAKKNDDYSITNTTTVNNFMDHGFFFAPYYKIHLHISTSSLKIVAVGCYAILPALV
jgi:hypothetical protein